MITLRARHYRRIANLKLRGQRGTLALTLLIYFAICGIFFLPAYLSAFLPIVPDLVKAANSYYDFHSFFRHEFIDFMFSFLLAYLPYAAGISALFMFFLGAFSLSFKRIGLSLVQGEKIQPEDLFKGFKHYIPSLVLHFLLSILISLWSLLLIVPGIVMYYSYSMSWFILAENPGMPVNEARKKSMQLMEGNKAKLFCLDMSFLGWLLLSALTFGILLLWVMPRILTAHAAFYRNLVPATRDEKPVQVQAES